MEQKKEFPNLKLEGEDIAISIVSIIFGPIGLIAIIICYPRYTIFGKIPHHHFEFKKINNYFDKVTGNK